MVINSRKIVLVLETKITVTFNGQLSGQECNFVDYLKLSLDTLRTKHLILVNTLTWSTGLVQNLSNFFENKADNPNNYNKLMPSRPKAKSTSDNKSKEAEE